ncbi:type IV secretion protein Rhs, partial [Chryseobacterium sp. SSA4.19]|uniref:RHS repeat-associated core domain-containing protein n=1 Tax=Chryseobacterium sp. SSA4.19 TaxID=2919915 RepID=UPI001F4F9BDF
MKHFDKKIKSFLTVLALTVSILSFSQAPPRFHDTMGNIDVNGGGQLQYSLDIAVPPGVKSVGPKISLEYTSGSGNGIAGYGWNISGISTISRVGRTIEKDGEANAAQLDDSDYYSFNGQRLILKSGEYGKDGAEYVTEKYSNIKIKSVGAFSGAGWQGPDHWEVTFEDGSQAWYGTGVFGTQARTTLEYNIGKWKDAQGNTIRYTYESTWEAGEGGVSRLTLISWGGNETLGKTPYNSIQFNYGDRNIKEESYNQGLKYNQNKLLTEIKVSSAQGPFKRYGIEYIDNGTNYHFIKKITEYNSNDEPANPVEFTYPAPIPASVDYTGVLPYNNDSFDNIKFTGDFNGDSYLDFVMNNGVVKLGAFNDNFQDISTGKSFNAEAKVVNTLLDEEGQIYNGNGIVQYENGYLCGYILRNNTFVKVFNKQVYQSDCDEFAITCTTTAKLKNGDLDGDGIEDIFLTLSKRECFNSGGGGFDPQGGSIEENKLPIGTTCLNSEIGNFIIDLKNADNAIATYYLDAGINESAYTSQQYADIDGDGKVDIINVSNSAYTVFEFVKTAPDQYIKKIKFSSNLAETKDSEYPVLFGDFNGDRNLDFAIPVTSSQNLDNWRFYMGTKKGFQSVLKEGFIRYRKPTQPSSTQPVFDRHFYSIADINKDGKSDVVLTYSKSEVGAMYSNGNVMYRKVQYIIHTYLANGGTDFVPGFSATSPTYTGIAPTDYNLFQPLTNPIKANNNYYDIFVFKNTRVHKYKSPTSIAELSRITGILQGGVTTSVTYKELNPDTNPNFYAKEHKEYYPYFSLARADNSYAVSQLEREGKKQDFRYRGMMGDMHGNGMLGFFQAARSSWYANGFENTKIWSGVERDSQNKEMPFKEWSIRTNDESKIFPADISENNTQLLSFSATYYKTDKLLNGQVVATVVDADKPKIVTATLVRDTRKKDFLTGTLITGNITYGNYYLPAQSITNINNGYAVMTSTFNYIHNPSGTGANYYIGRPENKTDQVQAYGDIKSEKEEYTYDSNNLLKTLKKWNRDNTGFLQEMYAYDGYGNMTQKTVTNSIDSQTLITKAEYDTRGRFVIKNTDNLGLETGTTYNDRGQILTQEDPYNNTVTNIYDNWGKLSSSANSIGGIKTFQYNREVNDDIIVTQNNPDGAVSKKYTNRLGQEYKVSNKAFGQGQYVSITSQYDVLGRKIKDSEPYFEGQNPSQWNTILYDDTVFPSKVTSTSFTGKQMETSVSGLTTFIKEVNGYGRINSKTTDAVGNVVSSTDKGGTIQFSYNAAGDQIKAQYAENIVTTNYDAWGRKLEFNDPSNGIYKYEYDGFGQPKKIISPKGTKIFSYNALGQLVSQQELSTNDGGQATNKNITFSYDTKGRLLSKSGTSQGQVYSSTFTYDPQGRVTTSTENSNGKVYSEKGIVYDNKGRVSSYEKELQSSGMQTKVSIENVYSAWNGELYQIKDKNSGKILWELQGRNAKGMVLNAKLGAANINNTYDSSGFLKTVNHSSAAKPDILKLTYTFDAIKNELKDRKTEGDFYIEEKFYYDDNNRLINWTDPVTGLAPSSSRNVYDIKGRITQNDQVGTIKFENSSKIYQPTGMTLNAAGEQNYNNDLIQTIVYNENNDPIHINGEKARFKFKYGLGNMRQRVDIMKPKFFGPIDPGPGTEFKTAGVVPTTPVWQNTLSKFYNEDNSFEVILDQSSGMEKHILYIAGTPYESNITYVKDFAQSTGSGSYKFLHKDYIGSILAISDEEGNKLEGRHFDAWGNFTHLKMGIGPVTTDKALIASTVLLIDRGYTSHEHLMEVGLIHMNGRLYDPLLRRFLNADENIQDPTNTQIYNKYGYAVNNPLMYNDPSGEVLPFLIGVGLSYIGATLISGAIIGAVISMGVYILQATINNNFSLGGFVKSIAIGAVTGAVSAGVGEIFQAGGFLA